MAALMARLGVIGADHPILARKVRNWDGLITGTESAVADLATGKG